jgi:chromosome partitioning protein
LRRIAISNQKGGSAKSTTTVNLAAALAEEGRRILVVDLDPQANTTTWLGAPIGNGALDLFTTSTPVGDLIAESQTSGIAVIPSSPQLNGAERSLAREVGAETTLRRRLGEIAPGRWDYVMIDTPPTLGLLTLNALAAVEELIVPVETHVLALAGVAQLLETIKTVNERLNPVLAIGGVLACRVDIRTRHANDVIESLRGTFKNLMFKTMIRENIRLAEAPSFHQPITAYDSRSTGAADYRALAVEVLAQEGKRASA